MDDYRGIPAGTLNRIAKHGYIPDRWRYRFGLPIIGKVYEVCGPGTVIPYSQATASRRCSCGTHFIPNHPKRHKCFTCSPIKGGNR